jgi:hypothetical protein
MDKDGQNSPARKKTEGRLESRFLCADLVHVIWAADGQLHEDDGNLEDVSPSGCRLLMGQTISENTAVEIRCGDHVFNGTVRYTRTSDLGFDLGIQFAQRGTWKREDFEPQHLLDVNTLLREND